MKAEPLESIEESIKNCHDCERSKSRSRAVTGKGDIHPSLFLLGEAPGQEDDKSGCLFSGEAGVYVQHMLKLYGLDKETTYTTSILKCWAPGEIKKSHLQSCYHWTFKQIMTVDPHWILVMGRNVEIGMWGRILHRTLPEIHH
ncbi:MAG: uracil-DNA glycosylase family protein [bacterium]